MADVTGKTESLTSLCILQIPPNLLHKKILKEHFSKFGTVTQIVQSSKSSSCIVCFENNEQAKSALENGKELDGIKLNLFWGRIKSRSAASGSLEERSKERRKLRHASRSGPSSSSPFTDKVSSESKRKLMKLRSKKKLSWEVEEELQAMSGIEELRPISRPSRVTKVLPPVPVFKEPQQKTETESVAILSNKAEDILSLLNKPAITAEERYNALEARDKLMRMRNVKSTDLASAEKNVGICPDMCPEKERYHREAKHQVYCYEMSSDSTKQHVKMNAHLAIKQYSRSSADQDMPLPHDLRPTPVLRMTMEYMLTHIMNRAEDPNESLRDWYFFLWDRTRSIRKDITQQELCDSETVTLLEQCARFHILCSELLVDEDSSVFDPKINTENLTKCLQTLKYMYSDMALKGEQCSNEPEFQAYILLLNLNDTGRIVEELKLNLDIQSSEPIKFALAVHGALSTNNYVKFFKLVKEATYLNACILHRYFTQVRIHALFTICKSYCFGSTKAQFSVTTLRNILAFEDDEETVCFCEYYGLPVSPNGQEIILSGKTSIDVTSPPPTLKRSVSVVASKKKCTIAEVISGGNLPSCESYNNHVPHNSFDENGILKLEAYDATDQAEHLRENLLREIEESLDTQQPVSSKKKFEEYPEQSASDKRGSAQNFSIMDIAPSSSKNSGATPSPLQFSFKIPDPLQQPHPFTVKHVASSSNIQCSDEGAHGDGMPKILQFSDGYIQQFCDSIISDCINDMIRECLLLVIQEQQIIALQKAKEEVIHQSQKQFVSESSKAILNELTDEVCGELIRETVLNLAKEIISEEIFYLLLDETIEGIVYQVIDDARMEQLHKISQNMAKRRMIHYVQKWKYKARKMRKRRDFLKTFSFISSNLNLEEQANLLEVSGIPKEYNLRSQRLFSQKPSPFKPFLDAPALPDIGILRIGDIIEDVYTKRLKEVGEDFPDVFWKLIVSTPDKEESPYFSDIVADWTESVFADGPLCHEDVHLLESGILTKTKCSTVHHDTFGICVQRCIGVSPTQGVAPNQVKHRGANGVLFFVTSFMGGIDKSCRRLITLLRSLSKRPLLPVAVITFQPLGPVKSSLTEDWFASIKKGGVLDDFNFFCGNLYSSEHTKEMIVSALKWLASKRPCTLPVYSTYLPQLWELCLGENFWTRIHQHLMDRSVYVMPQNPNNILHLYNLTVDKLMYACLDEDVLDHSFGPPEFEEYLDISSEDATLKNGLLICPKHWGTPQYCKYLLDLLNSIHLPETVYWPPANYEELIKSFDEYCKENGLHTAVWELNRLCQSYVLDNMEITGNNIEFELLLQSFPWSKVVQVLAEHKLNNTDCTDPFFKGSCTKKIIVTVKKSFIESFSTSSWWLGEAELFEFGPKSPMLPAELLENTNEVATEHLELTSETEINEEHELELPNRKVSTSGLPLASQTNELNQEILLMENKLRLLEDLQGNMLEKLQNQVICESENLASSFGEQLPKEMLETKWIFRSDKLSKELLLPMSLEQGSNKILSNNNRSRHISFDRLGLKDVTSVSFSLSDNSDTDLERTAYDKQSSKSEAELFTCKLENSLKRNRSSVEKATVLASEVRRLSSQQEHLLQELEKSIGEDYLCCQSSEAKKFKSNVLPTH